MESEQKPLLEARNLRKEFGGLVAVEDVSISIRENSLHSIIGPNGAGKTTFFNMISGVLRPTKGQVIFKGRDITHLPIHRIAHLGIGRSFQITNIFPNLTVIENIRLAAQAMGKDNLRIFTSSNHFKKYLVVINPLFFRFGKHQTHQQKVTANIMKQSEHASIF